MADIKLKNRGKEIDDLVVRVQKGDVDAFSALYDIFITPIYRYIYYKVEASEVEDLTEMVFLKVWENIHRYKKGQNPFASWVFRIAHNLVIDHYRLFKGTVQLDVEIPDRDERISPKNQVERTLTKEYLKGALSKLKDSHRELLLLKFMNDLSNEEIAEQLGKSEGSLRIMQFRALKALRKVLADMGIDDPPL